MTAATSDNKCPAHDIFCPVHGDVKADIRNIVSRQDSRHCGAHEAMINTANRDIEGLKGASNEQWIAINQLRRLVYIGMGGVSVAAFFGSIIGQMVVAHFKR